MIDLLGWDKNLTPHNCRKTCILKLTKAGVRPCNRWFKNADVVGTLLFLEKKQISEPNLKEEIYFWLVNKDIRNLDAYEKETIVNSVVLSEEIDSDIAT